MEAKERDLMLSKRCEAAGNIKSIKRKKRRRRRRREESRRR